ncbi:MAG: phosphosulfolactate synthase [Candidatus Sumerlaeota bacterium]|nr:phosphosulfolactate synthase [Candidatus Sumerlaeota bacterium]
MSHPFEKIPIPPRQSKPRQRGLTMMIDWGLPLALQRDCLQSQGAYVDEAKIAAGIPRLLPEAILKAKVAAYGEHGILAFPGGQFCELAIAQGNFEVFLEGAKAAGFLGIEISDNLLRITPQRKKAAIAQAVGDYGLKVMGEVGRKDAAMTTEALIADVENCLEGGASLVLLEAYELFHGGIRREAIDALVGRVPLERLMFELPVVVLPGVTREQKHRVGVWLVKEFGTEVNLANVEWDEIYITELVRRGAAGDASHPQGAYRRAGIGE